MKKDRLILLHRQAPDEWEIHRNEIDQTNNLLLTLKDREFAENLVEGYNNRMEWLEEDNEEWLDYDSPLGKFGR